MLKWRYGDHPILRDGIVAGLIGAVSVAAWFRLVVADVRRKLMDPTFDNSTSMMPNLGPTSDQIEAIVAYLAALSRRDDP